MSELKPCPKCATTELSVTTCVGGDRAICLIECLSCGFVFRATDPTKYEAETLAHKHWNVRYEETVVIE